MLTLNLLRSVTIGLGLFAGMTAAQAALTITFEQNDNTGHLNIIFSGQANNPFAATESYTSGSVSVSGGSIAVSEGDGANPFYANPAEFDWGIYNMLSLMNSSAPLISSGGTGGYTIYSDGLFDTEVQIMSTTYAAVGELFTWDGYITYLANLANFGLGDGRSGTITFVKSGQSVSVDWSTTVIPVPEPATYALVLGLGVASIALVRRRRASR